jgi:hypothetical protein
MTTRNNLDSVTTLLGVSKELQALLEAQNAVPASDNVPLHGAWQQSTFLKETQNVTEIRAVCAVLGQWRKPPTSSDSGFPQSAMLVWNSVVLMGNHESSKF